MRILTILALSAALLTPAVAMADPGAQSAPATSAQAMPAAPVAPAGQQTAQASPAAASNESELDRIECRSSPPPTGTRLGATRECHTVREWNTREQDAQAELKRAQMLGHQSQALSAPGGK